MQKGTTIWVTTPSSGVKEPFHEMVKQAFARLKAKAYPVICGETVWTQKKAKSAPAITRAAELNALLQNKEIGLIFPPWGGELLIEIVDQIEYNRIQPKWILGYSDTSVLLLAVTLSTGIATAHGSNLIDSRGEYADQTTAMWKTVMATRAGESVQQFSSKLYQKAWGPHQDSNFEGRVDLSRCLPKEDNLMNLALWIATGLLAVVALAGGIIKTFIPKEKLAEQPGGGWVKDFSVGFVKTIGVLEILATAGLILPTVVEIAPILVSVTAVCWMLVMIGAILFD